MVFWLGEKIPNAVANHIVYKKKDEYNLNRMVAMDLDTFFSITPMIGYRENSNQPWKICIFHGKKTIGMTKESADRALAEFCFVNLKDIEFYYLIQDGVHKGEFIWKKYGNNLQDANFWDNWMWQKDTVGSDSFYNFQETRPKGDLPEFNGVSKCFKCLKEEWIYPKIEYHKEILDMYSDK